MPTGRWDERRRARLPILVAACLALLLAMAGAQAGAAGGDLLGSECRATLQTWVNPAWVSVGEQVNVRNYLKFVCPRRQRAYHLVLVIDLPAAAPGGAASWVTAQLEYLLEAMDWQANPGVGAAVVGYSSQARTMCPFSGDQATLQHCLRQALAEQPHAPGAGQGALAEGIREGAKALIMARRLDPPRPTNEPLEEGLLVLASADNTSPCPGGYCRERAEADAARELGIQVEVVCLAGECLSSQLPTLVGEEHFYLPSQFDAAVSAQVAQAWATQLRVRSATVTEFLEPRMALVRHSLDPPSATYDPQRHLINWPATPVGEGEARMAYAVAPTAAGTFSVRRLGYGVYVDTRGDRGSVVLPDSSVIVTTVDRPLVKILLPWLSRHGWPHTFLSDQEF